MFGTDPLAFFAWPSVMKINAIGNVGRWKFGFFCWATRETLEWPNLLAFDLYCTMISYCALDLLRPCAEVWSCLCWRCGRMPWRCSSITRTWSTRSTSLPSLFCKTPLSGWVSLQGSGFFLLGECNGIVGCSSKGVGARTFEKVSPYTQR